MSGKGIGVRTIAITGIMIALVFVFTRVPPIPIGIGYFNFSDVAIYFVAFAFGPWVGFVAGGIGAALADISLGWSQFAILTFFAHGLEGLVAGYLGYRLFPKAQRRSAEVLWRIVLALGWIPVALFIAILIPVKVLLGKAHELQDTVAKIIEQQEQLPGLALGWLAGTVVMVGLYFVGEYSVPAMWGGPPQAITEWPFNVLQNVAGGIVGIPLVLAVRRAYPPITQMGLGTTWKER